MPRKITTAEAKTAYRKGASLATVAKRWRCCPTSARLRLIAAGVRMRGRGRPSMAKVKAKRSARAR